MDIDKLTIGEAREIARLVSGGVECSTSHSWQLGMQVIIRTVTHYYTGRVAAITDSDIVLENAAWVADTGRWNTALAKGALDEVEPYPLPCVVMRGAIVDWTEWSNELIVVVK